jgi:hypothetical protein
MADMPEVCLEHPEYRLRIIVWMGGGSPGLSILLHPVSISIDCNADAILSKC